MKQITNEERAVKVYSLYLGCTIRHCDGSTATLFGVNLEELELVHETGMYGTSKIETSDCRLILRSLKDLTDSEKIGWYDNWPLSYAKTDSGKILIVNEWIGEQNLHMSPAEFQYLLSIGIDLFGLIESGIAIPQSDVK